MSRDVFVQDVSRGIRSIDEIPDDWEPGPLGVTYDRVVRTVRSHAGRVEAASPDWIHVEGDGLHIELSIDPDSEPLMGFAFHDRSSDPVSSRRFMHAVLDDLGLRAFDPTGSDSGIFEFVDEA